MSYVSGIFYIDFVNGLDTARTALTTVVADNPTGTVTRMYKVGHGLTTGAIVVTSAFTAWLSGSWKITRVDADYFTLDDCVWQATADANGTVTPHGGSSWADAWKTTTLGATAARIQAGDEIRIAKSPDPYSVGNADWTQNSKTVTLATSGRTKVIENGDAGDWTAVNATSAARLAVATEAKEGSYCMKIIQDATPTTTQVQAYYATGTLDLSAYQGISFWIKNEAAILATHYTLNLYTTTDASGAAAHSFAIPAIPSVREWVAFNIYGGGNLTNGIKSIALVNGSVAPTPSKYVYLDNIIATKFSGGIASDINLTSLISKNSAAQDGTEEWLPIQSINDTVILIGNINSTKANAGRGYSGTTETTKATYCREVVPLTMQTGVGTLSSPLTVNATTLTGNSTSGISYKGGYDITNPNLCNGETFWSGQNELGGGFYFTEAYDYITISHLNFVHFYSGISAAKANFKININDCQTITACYRGIWFNASVLTFNNLRCLVNNGIGIYCEANATCVLKGTIATISGNFYGMYTLAAGCLISAEKISKANNNDYFMYNTGKITIGEVTDSSYNSSSFVYNNGVTSINKITTTNNAVVIKHATGTIYLYDWTSTSDTADIEFVAIPTYYIADCFTFSGKNDGTINNDYVYALQGTITKQNSVKEAGTNYSIKYSPSGVRRKSEFPLQLPITNGYLIAVNANKLVTFTVRMRKTATTNIIGGIRIAAPQLGITSASTIDWKMTNTADTWETVTATFTPTEAGVIELTPYAYYADAASTYTDSVYFGAITISQAD